MSTVDGMRALVQALRAAFVLPSIAAIGLLAVRSAQAADPVQAAVITVSTTAVAAIDPQLFGVNYVWHLVPGDRFDEFSDAMRDVAHATNVRYPGGWAAEWLDWASNEERGGTVEPEAPGIDADGFLSRVENASFVTPSAAAIRDPAQTGALVDTVTGLVRRYGGRVETWEIGNEWWLQRGAKHDPAVRRQNLEAYAALVATLVPAMKAIAPTIRIYATGDWTRPEEFATLRRLAGAAAWAGVDGVSIHPYCGVAEEETLCSSLPRRAAAIRAATGKTRIFASEWSLGQRVNPDSFGIRNANQLVTAIRTLAEAGLSAAAYWPPVKAVPAIAFVSADYRRPFANGLLFGWMARHYRGEALPAKGDLPAAAARSDEGTTVFVASMGDSPRRVRIPLAGTGLGRVVSAEVLFSREPDHLQRSRLAEFAPLPTTMREGAVEFGLNPGTPGRGSGWEIARVTLR